MLRDDDYDAHTITAGGSLLIPPGGAIALGRDLSTNVNGGAPVAYSFDSDFPLSDTADEISLLDADLVPVDRVTWTAIPPAARRSPGRARRCATRRPTTPIWRTGARR